MRLQGVILFLSLQNSVSFLRHFSESHAKLSTHNEEIRELLNRRRWITPVSMINADRNESKISSGSLSFIAPYVEPDSEITTTTAQIPVDASFLDQMNSSIESKDSTLPSYLGLSRDFSKTENRYYQLVAGLTPNDMLAKFAQNAPRNVQEAVRSTIVSILGSLPSYALDAALVTTNSKLANLMFQMQLTGYMFKNAEYRMSLTRSLKGLPRLPPPQSVTTPPPPSSPRSGSGAGPDEEVDEEVPMPLPDTLRSFRPSDNDLQMEGRVTVTDPSGKRAEVDAADLMNALSTEVAQLRNELAIVRAQRENELQSNMLTYIQALPEKDLADLTSGISPEVMESIQLLVNSLMLKLGIPPPGPGISEALVQQSVAALAQLCMWQMVIGYKLRELEALDRGIDL